MGELRHSSTHSLISALYGGEWSASRPGSFTPRERAPGTHWIGGWVASRVVLDARHIKKWSFTMRLSVSIWNYFPTFRSSSPRSSSGSDVIPNNGGRYSLRSVNFWTYEFIWTFVSHYFMEWTKTHNFYLKFALELQKMVNFRIKEGGIPEIFSPLLKAMNFILVKCLLPTLFILII